MTGGLALALGSALGTNVAFLFKQRGAVLAAEESADGIRCAALWACSVRAGSRSDGWWRSPRGGSTSARSARGDRDHGRAAHQCGASLLGVAAGVLFGVSDIALKYFTEAVHRGLNGIVSEWTLAASGAGVLRLGSRTSAGPGCGGDRLHVRGRQARSDHGRH
jgi:hypothetical protein